MTDTRFDRVYSSFWEKPRPVAAPALPPRGLWMVLIERQAQRRRRRARLIGMAITAAICMTLFWCRGLA
jgi:hypothetical protein